MDFKSVEKLSARQHRTRERDVRQVNETIKQPTLVQAVSKHRPQEALVSDGPQAG
jgi:hypothetical protein